MAPAPDAGRPDWPSQQVPASTVPEAGVRRDVLRVDGVVPPANPLTGDETPGELNVVQVLRYRQDVDPPAPATVVIVALPGFLGGGASWDGLARAMVKRGAASGQVIEVWAIDRRSNLLEDLVGSDTAEAAGNPEIAAGYYNGTDTIDGQLFPGFKLQTDVPFESEWGLATHVEDVHRVVQIVPQAARRGHVFLMGHSLSGQFVEAYAAWRFADGVRGGDEIAGLIMIDGVLGAAPLSEDEYLNGTGSGFEATPGLDEIRERARYFELPIFGVEVYPLIEVMSLRALLAPDAVVADPVRDDTLRILLLMGDTPIPPLSNQAALGFGFDDESCPLTFGSVSAGHATGGPLESYENPFGGGNLVHPTDPGATYTWVDAPAAQPAEPTPLANLAHSFIDGRTNFAEWYFPNRLRLDLAAVGGARVPDDGWHAAQGLRAFDGALIDAPILAISSGFLDPADYEELRARVAPAVGAGRPNAGATRDLDTGFRSLEAAGQTHTDPLVAADGPSNPVPAAIEQFVAANAEAGVLTIVFP